MNKPAIIFFDIDGTLLDFGKKELSPKTRETLLKLRKNGIRICIATGRSPLAVPTFAGVEFDAYLTYNGCYCYEGNKTIYSNPMPQVDVQTIIRNAAVMGRAMSVATKNRLISNGTDPDLEQYYAFGNQKNTDSAEWNVDSLCAICVMELSSALQLRDKSVNTLTYQNVFSKMILYANQNRQIFTRQKGV